MNNFRSDNRSGGRRDSYNSRGNFGSRDSRGGPQLHDAVCDQCGKDCKVPFRPTGNKPVYCSDCFEKQSGRDDNRSGGRKDSYRKDFRGGDSRRPPQVSVSDRGISKFVEKIDILNGKLDKIIDLLSLAKEKKPEPVEVKPNKNKEVKKPKKQAKAKSASGEAKKTK
ncbi:hypothetical protein KKE45_00130 [Patescibacteria group bacterium]|nr:hypothetical protein [Patescibacteria group bacterium]